LKAFTYLGKTWVLVWLLIIWFHSTGRQQPVLIAFLALILISLTVIPLKVSVKRPRPYEVIKAGQKAQEQHDLDGHTSFPSGDAAAAFAVATVTISFVSWPLACLVLAACAGIALIRVTSMAHYPSDVFAGAAIGSFAGWLAIQIDHRWLPLRPPRFNLNRGISTLAIILMPLSFGLFEGIDKLVIFLETYGLLAICILLAAK
jgi:undecaprenyl-diphosphatase